MRARFHRLGVELSARSGGSKGIIALGLAGIGRATAGAMPASNAPALGDCAPGALRDEADACLRRLEYARHDATEWWENRPGGLEQGFTLRDRPAGLGALRVEVDVLGATVTVEPGGMAASLRSAQGLHLRYGGVTALDATGRRLPAKLTERRGGLALEVEDGGARYPLVIDPLVTSFVWTAESDQAEAHFGLASASAGDVNGDGFSDVIVGADQFDAGELDEGRAYVYLGSPSGLALTPAWTAEGDQAAARFGTAVASAGDVNGDGFSDVIVGARLFDDGQTDEGRAVVYFGSSTGLALTAAWTKGGDQAGAEFGTAVASAGDVNGDGFSDVIVGARLFDSGQIDEGRAVVYLGSSAGLASAVAWSAEADAPNANLGAAVASAGDVNGDGYSDVIVGAQGYAAGETNEGRALVYLGSASGLAVGAAWAEESDQAEARFGRSVATAGDVNGDGYSDVIVGADGFQSTLMGEGRASVYLGGASGLAVTAAWTADGEQANAGLGTSVAGAGDVNGDGFADVAVGASGFADGQANEGHAALYLGSESGLALTPAWTTDGEQANAHLGASVASAGDVNGDGFSDLIVGADGYSNGQSPSEGRAFVYLGAASGLSLAAARSAQSDQAGALLAGAVAGAGDVNGDGFSDVIVGASDYDNGQTDEGRVFLYFGAAAGQPVVAWAAEGEQIGAHLGSAVAGAGDVNGDGFSDVIVGAKGYDGGQLDEGRALVYLGSTSGLASSPAWTAESNQAGAAFGSSVASAGDVNGDGFGDVLVGAPTRDDGETDEGQALVYLGSATGLEPSSAWVTNGEQAGAELGCAVASAGDVNGDGFSDVIVGASGYDGGQTDAGQARVFHGSEAGLALTAAWTTEGDQANAALGAAVAGAGDVNGDGFGDVLVGAPAYDGPQADEGRAAVYLGSSAGLSSVAAWSAESDQAGAGFGFAVASAGDVNGDGFADVVIGAPGYHAGETDEGRAYAYLGSASGLESIPDFTAEGDQTGARFGAAVANAGDVDGDGFSDVIVGAPSYEDGQTDEGRIFLYTGNGGDGTTAGTHPLVQVRRPGTTTPIAPYGLAATLAFDVRARARTPFGRGSVGLLVETKPRGVAFDGAGVVASATFVDSGLAGVALTQAISGLAVDADYHVRIRTRYAPWLGWAHGASRWMHAGNLGDAHGVHLRTPCVDSDSDGTCDTTDGCDTDPLKIVPGVCGCGEEDVDADADGKPNCIDACPTEPAPTIDGCPTGSGGQGGGGGAGGAAGDGAGGASGSGSAGRGAGGTPSGGASGSSAGGTGGRGGSGAAAEGGSTTGGEAGSDDGGSGGNAMRGGNGGTGGSGADGGTGGSTGGTPNAGGSDGGDDQGGEAGDARGGKGGRGGRSANGGKKSAPAPRNDSGCGCRVGDASREPSPALLGGFGLALGLMLRRRRLR